MARRERIEDIGKMEEKLSNLMDHELFSVIASFGCRRSKDFAEHFNTLDEEKSEELLYQIAYGLEKVYSEICDLWGIAVGEDE